MKCLTLSDRVEVLPALHGRRVEPAPTALRPDDGGRGARWRFEQRSTRASRFPVERSLARSPEAPWLGRFLDVEV